MKTEKLQNIIKIKLIILSFLLCVSQKGNTQQRDNLRQYGDRYENTGIPNNCDNKLYSVSVSGNLFEIEKIDSSYRSNIL